MPRMTIVDLSPAEQAHLLAEVRRARYGYLLALQILLLCAAQRSPTEIATVLFCSRSTVYRVVRAYRAGDLEGRGKEGEARPPARRPVLGPALKRSMLAILKPCRACVDGVGPGGAAQRLRWNSRPGGGSPCRPRRCAAGCMPWTGNGSGPSWWPRMTTHSGWRNWPAFAWRSSSCGQARPSSLLTSWTSVCLPKVGYQWMPKGTQVEVMTPGTNEKRYLAGALNLSTGTTAHCVWYRKTTGLFLDLLATLDRAYPARAFTRLSVVVDNAKIHHAQEVAKWVATHPRFELLYLPTYCPRANPIERAFGDVHDKCTRNHTRKRMWHLVQDVKQHLQVNGPWPYALSELYYTPEVTAAVQALHTAESAPEEISQLAA